MSSSSFSPFLVKQEFLSPLLCEEVTDYLQFFVPDVDQEGRPIKTTRHHEISQNLIFERLDSIIPEIESRYKSEYVGTSPMEFEWYPEGCSGEPPRCENSNYLRKKWLRTKNNDFTGILFLSTFQQTTPFDHEYEVYGGKLEFAQHGFGFNPERGTLIIFPSEPHFLNNTTDIYAGDLIQVRFHITAKQPFLYNPQDFPGDYRTWLQEFA